MCCPFLAVLSDVQCHFPLRVFNCCHQALLIGVGGSAAAAIWGIAADSAVHAPAMDFLRVRALGLPFLVMLLALQVRPAYIVLYRPHMSSPWPFSVMLILE